MSTILLTVAQVAARAQVTPRCVRTWIHAGVLPGVQLGGHLLRVRESDLDAFLSTQPPQKEAGA